VIKAVNKFFDRQAGSNAVVLEDPAKVDSFIYLKSDRKTHKLRLDEIRYVESLDEYVKVHVTDKFLMTRESISSIEQKLPSVSFVRIHRSFIINVKYVSIISGDGIEIGGKELPFGRAYKKSALAALSMKDR
jgi:two-component system LytT family response regulator